MNESTIPKVPQAIDAPKGGCIRIIDQRRLPLEMSHMTLSSHTEVIDAIKSLAVRGAPAIGIAGAYGLAIEVTRSGRCDREYLQKVASDIRAARPTAVNLAWAVDRLMARFLSEQPTDLKSTKELLWDEATKIHDEDRQMCRQMGAYGAELLHNGDSVLTHCNTGALATGGIGTALGVIYTSLEQGKNIKVYADETRPLLQGSRLTCWELRQAGIDVTLICDNTAGMLMRQKKIDAVIVGADRIAANGDFANKIGTYSVAVLAAAHNIPFYVAAPTSTFDDAIETGQQIVIEERDASEVTCGFGRQTAPDGIAVFSPAFDVTPASLVSYYITDKGLKPGGRQVTK